MRFVPESSYVGRIFNGIASIYAPHSGSRDFSNITNDESNWDFSSFKRFYNPFICQYDDFVH